MDRIELKSALMEATLQKQQEYSDLEVDVDKSWKRGVREKPCPRQCWERAWKYLSAHPEIPEAMLVHGKWHTLFDHAWVELPGDIVFDGVMQRFYGKEDYYREFETIKIAEYTLEEAIENVSRYDCYGLWHNPDELKRRWLEFDESRE